jgi:putative N6-adenine-specific DNA methylase
MEYFLNEYKLACPCIFGLESLVADELTLLGYTDITSTNGRVVFTGDEASIARTNINLRCAERVLIQLAQFEAGSFEELFQGVKAIEWENYVGRDDAFPVKGWSLNSKLHSVPDCQAIIKKAVVERLKAKHHVEWFKETGAKLQIQFSILKDVVSVFLDTSGEGLHKRGYRANANEAPLKETLAAAMVKLARPFTDKPFYDPMCGSGTILIEAAMYMKKLAPGLNRSFAAESWGCLDKKIWNAARSEALSRIDYTPFEVQGFDIDEHAVALTLENAKKAGVGANVKAMVQDIKNFSPKDSRGVIVCNPPYGERMLEIKEAEELYNIMGQVFSKLKGFHFFIISPSEKFEAIFGKRADKKRKLYNGMIKCDLFQYFKGNKPEEK